MLSVSFESCRTPPHKQGLVRTHTGSRNRSRCESKGMRTGRGWTSPPPQNRGDALRGFCADVSDSRFRLLSGPGETGSDRIRPLSYRNPKSLQRLYRGSETLSYMRREERTGADGRSPPRANGAYPTEHWELLTIWTKSNGAASPWPIPHRRDVQTGTQTRSERCHRRSAPRFGARMRRPTLRRVH